MTMMPSVSLYRATTTAVSSLALLLCALLLTSTTPGAEATSVKVRPFEFGCSLKGMSVRQFTKDKRRAYCRAYTRFIGVPEKVRACISLFRISLSSLALRHPSLSTAG